MKTESKHTKGKAASIKNGLDFKFSPPRKRFLINVLSDNGLKSIATLALQFDDEDEESEANAQLIADAFNVTNETGLTPRELQESHAELLEELIKCKNEMLYLYRNQGAELGMNEETVDNHLGNNKLYQSALKAIKNAKK